LTGAFRVGVWLPKNYLPTTPLPGKDVVGGMNRLILLPEMADSTGQFYHDLLIKLQARDKNILSAVFYFDLYNELHFDLAQPPFSRMSGQYLFNGISYDLGNAASRQALMDQTTQSWVQVVSGKVKAVAPDLLVTASSGCYYALDHPVFDGEQRAKAGASTLPFPPRPSAMVRGGADLIDLHFYPSPGRGNLPAFHLRAPLLLRSNEITESTALKVPLIAGEFGATKTKFPDVTKIPGELVSTFDVLRQFHFSGFAVWDWNGQGDLWTLQDDILRRTLAPKYHPDLWGFAFH